MYDIVTIGAVTRDVFLASPFFKRVNDPKHLKKLGFFTGEAQCFPLGEKIEVQEPVGAVGGGAANAAVTFARQGFKTASFFKIKDDLPGRMILEALKKEKIALFPTFEKKTGTAYSVILLSPGGERTILNFRGASEDVKLGEVPSVKLKAKWAYISTGRIHLPVMKAIIAHLRKNKMKIAMNPSSYYLRMGLKKLRPLLGKLDVILVNREEAAYLTGCKYEEEAKIFKKFDAIIGGIAVMTDGPKGVMVSDGKNVYSAGIYKEKKIADRTGAGDAFGSGFVSALARRKAFDREAIMEAIRLGSANGTSVVEYVGAQEGILKKHEFKREKRWWKLAIKVRKLA